MAPKQTYQAPLTVTRDELLVDGSDSEFRVLVHNALAFTGRLLAIRDGYAAYLGLTGIQYTILISIAHLEKTRDVNINTLADHLHLSGAFVTIEVGKLVRKGLVGKVQDQNDRRRVSLSVAPKGREALARLAPVQQQVNNVHFGSLSREQFFELNRIMADLVESTDRGLKLQSYLVGAAAEEAASEKSLPAT